MNRKLRNRGPSKNPDVVYRFHEWAVLDWGQWNPSYGEWQSAIVAIAEAPDGSLEEIPREYVEFIPE